ncbi:MAG: cupin domain-containing protein [Spirochaetales bacterium]|nr:cupin domain-containing protein [Spirochaetales bacterium]
MQILDNGVIVGNYHNEKWETVAPGLEQLEVNGKNITLSFQRILPERAGMYAQTPSGHKHDDMEQMTIMLEGRATVVIDGTRTPVRKGSHWLAPKGVFHGLDLRESPEGVTILQIFPAGKRPPLPAKG